MAEKLVNGINFARQHLLLIILNETETLLAKKCKAEQFIKRHYMMLWNKLMDLYGSHIIINTTNLLTKLELQNFHPTQETRRPDF